MLGFTQQWWTALPSRSSQSSRKTGTKVESQAQGDGWEAGGEQEVWETAGIWDQEGLHRGMMSEGSCLCKDAKKKGEEKRESQPDAPQP